MADDDVQGEVYLDNRSKKLRARNIVVVKTGLRKKAEALEASLLSAASVEKGVVVSLREDFGFLRSASRHEHVKFAYTDIILPDEEGEGGEEEEEFRLEEGQCVQFKVIKLPPDPLSMGAQMMRNRNGGEGSEGPTGPTGEDVAKQIVFLPANSVVFETVERTGCVGRVSKLPVLGGNNSNSNSNSRYKKEGTVAVAGPGALIFESGSGVGDGDGDGDGGVEEVPFFSQDIEHLVQVLDRVHNKYNNNNNNRAGGQQQQQQQQQQKTLLLRPYDSLSFDVVRLKMDGSLKASNIKLVEFAPEFRESGIVSHVKVSEGFG